MKKNVETSNETQNPELGISVVISSYLTKEKFILWFIIMPLFLLGLHLGAIITNISLNFYFVFPIFVRLTGILTGIWIWLSIYLYTKNYKKLIKLDNMGNKIKRIDIKEFREKGYLQELNRRFLHPLGLALEISIDDNNEKLGGIWGFKHLLY